MRNEGDSNLIVRLAERLKLHWEVLHTAVRLEGSWHERLRERHDEAVTDAITIGRRIIGGQLPADSLADLREQLMASIGNILASLETLPAESSLSTRTREIARNTIEEVTLLATLLAEGVDVRTCSQTAELRARRQLVRRLLGKNAPASAAAAPELIKLACMEAQRALERMHFRVHCGAGSSFSLSHPTHSVTRHEAPIPNSIANAIAASFT